MIELDMRTLTMMSGVASISACLAILLQSTQGQVARARLAWVAGFGTLAVGWFLIGLRGTIADTLSLIGGNTLVLSGFALLAIGTDLFAGRRPPWWLLAAAAALFPVGFAVLNWIGGLTPNALIVLVNAGGVMVAAMMVPAVVRCARGEFRRPAVVILVSLIIVVASFTLRIGSATEARLIDLMSEGGIHAIAFISYMITTIGLAIAFMMMINLSLLDTLRSEVTMRDRLLTLIGHDMRTPFNALLGGTEAMEHYARQNRPDLITSTAVQVHSAARSAHDLLETLLAWGHTHKTANGVSPEPVAIGDVVNRIATHYAPAIETKGLTLSMNGGTHRVHANPYAVEAVLRNIISNAIKFSPEGGTITLSAAREHDGMIRIAVEDQGSGLSVQAFDAFVNRRIQRSNDGTHGETGTGLGLYLAMEIARSAGGNLAADPAPGHGARLVARFPDGDTPHT